MPASFLSRGDTILRRQGRTARARRIAELAPECPQEKTLNIILEEDESRPSSPSSSSSHSGYSSSSQNLALKARRRHANVSDIRIARGMPTHDSSDVFALQYDAPRAAPSPPLSAQSSYDSFRLAFEDVAPQFPSPPGFCEPESPTSSTSSSPCSRTGEMPLTPSTSDDEGSFVNPYYVEIQPLVINKHSQKLHDVTHIDHSVKDPVALPEAYDSDSDSEWYTRELSKSITLRTPSFRLHKISRPDSIISAPPASKRRMSKASPSPSPPPRADSKRQSVRRSIIPNYPPPPPPKCDPRPPSISSTASLVDFPMHPACAPPKMPQVPARPPPRSSVPTESVFDDDAASAFSFSIYEVDLGDARSGGSSSSASAYSQPSFDAFAAHDVSFDLDGGMMLPVSLPATPNDIDELTGWDDEVEFVFDEEEEVQHSPVFPPSPAPSPPPPRSYYPSYSPSAAASPPAKHAVYMEEHTLKSKWSSSTLASVQQEHARRGASAKLRLYFGGGAATPKRGSAQSSTSKKGVPPTPTSPFGSALGLMSPRRSARTQAHTRGSSEVPVLGYGAPVGVRRRGSVATMSDTGSEQSFSSTSSSGLRRKPIPIEMFLRS